MGKIKYRCQIGDLKFEITCYVIDVETSYNLLLGRPWIRRNSIVPSTFHEIIKYVGEDENLRTLIVERHLFKGIENYFTNSLLYQDSLEVDENSRKNPTLATKQIRSQKKTSVSEK